MLLPDQFATLDDRTYAWDATGRKTRRTDVRPGGPGESHVYGHDALGRMTSATSGSLAVSYSLDGAGNRTGVDGIAPLVEMARTANPSMAEAW